MLEQLNNTQLIAVFFGLYMLSAGIGILLDRNSVPSILRAMIDNSAVGFLAGIVAFALGAVIVSIHQDWSSILASVVTVVGWIALVEGMLLLAFRKWFLGMFSFLSDSRTALTLSGVFGILLGIVFLIAGFQAI